MASDNSCDRGVVANDKMAGLISLVNADPASGDVDRPNRILFDAINPTA
ncbi:hypothetical protein RLDS_15955 [Sphingobium lactosutens DS20]|uniref:Uncharacterized protein n=1 Tax=Sphingobium lactosutens DS20 TaxID=1331060 RepID=T0IN63_9SPHN|nr:hypothetical protein RLDS_15955 [Sphingobium lactosutens DS20]